MSERFTFDPSPENVATLYKRAHFFRTLKGEWRYMPFGGDPVPCDDPTALFPMRAEFVGGYGASAAPAFGLFARYYPDKTGGVSCWEPMHEKVWMLYAPACAGEAAQRDWIREAFAINADKGQAA